MDATKSKTTDEREEDPPRVMGWTPNVSFELVLSDGTERYDSTVVEYVTHRML